MSAAGAFSGGCQCGAVRYKTSGGLRYPHVCHCRMCQKAAGNYFLPLGASMRADFALTRGEPQWFFSSQTVRRGFCGRCGTPLFYDIPGMDFINITLGSLDEPSQVKPEAQSNLDNKMLWFHDLDGLPIEPEGDTQPLPLQTRQHPDNDTTTWPPEEQT